MRIAKFANIWGISYFEILCSQYMSYVFSSNVCLSLKIKEKDSHLHMSISIFKHSKCCSLPYSENAIPDQTSLAMKL